MTDLASSGIHQLWGEDFIHHTGQVSIIYVVYAPQVRCHTAHVRKNTNFSLKYCVAVADFFVNVPYPFDWSFASLPQNQISSLSKKKKKKNFKYPLSQSKLDPLLLFEIIVDSTVLRRNFLIESFNRKSDNMFSSNTYPSRVKCIEVLTFNI